MLPTNIFFNWLDALPWAMQLDKEQVLEERDLRHDKAHAPDVRDLQERTRSLAYKASGKAQPGDRMLIGMFS